MPRRVVAYAPEFQATNQLISLGALFLAIGILPFIYNLVVSWARGPQASSNPWSALTLEWQTSSPPPIGNFDRPPVVTHGPYDYGEPLTRGEAAAD